MIFNHGDGTKKIFHGMFIISIIAKLLSSNIQTTFQIAMQWLTDIFLEIKYCNPHESLLKYILSNNIYIPIGPHYTFMT